MGSPDCWNRYNNNKTAPLVKSPTMIERVKIACWSGGRGLLCKLRGQRGLNPSALTIASAPEMNPHAAGVGVEGSVGGDID
jgi:hypothetical protein